MYHQQLRLPRNEIFENTAFVGLTYGGADLLHRPAIEIGKHFVVKLHPSGVLPHGGRKAGGM